MSSQSHWCPDYLEAVKQEQRLRSKAVIGEREKIAGREVVQLTPFLFDVLSAYDSPFAVNGKVTCAATLQFLYIVQPDFDVNDISDFPQWLEDRATDTDWLKAGEEILEYMDRTFMDAVDGKSSTPYCSFTARMCASMAAQPYGWDTDKTSHTPIWFIFQLLRAAAKSDGVAIINKHSDSVLQQAAKIMEDGIRSGDITQEQFDAINLRGREPHRA